MGLFFLVIFPSGYWLARLGKPYNGLLLNVHKLVALAAVVFLVITVNQVRKSALFGLVEMAVLAITALCFAGAIVSGGLVSIPRPMPIAASVLHKLLPYLTFLSTAGTLYLMFIRR
jgi:hypothetical protein